MEKELVRCAGGIVLGDGGTIAVVRGTTKTLWFFPKGHIDEGEADEEAARREIQEETGLTDLEFLDDLGEYTRPGIREPNLSKVIHMYLFAAPAHAPLAPTMEIEEAVWMPYKEVAGNLGNDKDCAWFATVFDRVREAIQRD